MKIKKELIIFKIEYISIVVIMGIILISNLITNKRLEKQINYNYHYKIVGKTTWYGKGKLKNGEKFDGDLLSCASDYFDRYSLLLVKDIATGKSVIVWNNDVHEATGIVCDLSKTAFKKIASLKVGERIVEITYLGILKKPNPYIFGKQLVWLGIQKTRIKHALKLFFVDYEKLRESK